MSTSCESICVNPEINKLSTVLRLDRNSAVNEAPHLRTNYPAITSCSRLVGGVLLEVHEPITSEGVIIRGLLIYLCGSQAVVTLPGGHFL